MTQSNQHTHQQANQPSGHAPQPSAQRSKAIELITAEMGVGAQITECRFGPGALLDAGLADMLRKNGRQVINGAWIRDDSHDAEDGAAIADAIIDPIVTPMVESIAALLPGHRDAPAADPQGKHHKMQAVQALVPRLADAVRHVAVAGRFPVVLGGDHSCAVGSWSGVADAYRAQGRIGLIWIDAHLDSHTPETSESQAPHGMPLAALLGHGASALTDIYGWRGKLAPEHAVVVGARSYEDGEVRLLASLGVRVIGIEEVQKRGLADCIDEAIVIASNGTVGYGVSFDVDAIDPLEAPGVGSPVESGIEADAAIAAMRHFADDTRLLAFELVEYNPERDDAERRTAAICLSLVDAALSIPAAGQSTASQTLRAPIHNALPKPSSSAAVRPKIQ